MNIHGYEHATYSFEALSRNGGRISFVPTIKK